MRDIARTSEDESFRFKWHWIVLLTLFIGVLAASIEITNNLAMKDPLDLAGSFLRELSGSLGVLALLPLLLHFFRRFPLTLDSFGQRLPLYLVAILLFGFLHTSIMTLTRELLYPVFGLGDYDPGQLLYRYLMEFQKQFLTFWFIFAIVKFFGHYESQRERRLRTAELEHQLSEAKLDLLKLQLNPHFLFNTLNLISSIMYEDLEKADRMIANLSGLLRASLSLRRVQKVPLEEELRLLRLYCEIMKARFGDRLTISEEIEDRASSQLFPTLMLQPLVENSIKHGLDEGGGDLTIRIVALVASQRLRVLVEDDGGGIGEEKLAGLGIGLTTVKERLKELYGDRGRLSIETRSACGFRVQIEIPIE